MAVSAIRFITCTCMFAAAASALVRAQTANVITACVSNKNEVAHIVASAADCKAKRETVVFWNQTGPQGAQGIVGATGAIGVAGPTGATGPQGLTGPVGRTGPQGSEGAAGPYGRQGATGVQGPVGVAGPTGPVGPQGAAGNPPLAVVTWFTDKYTLDFKTGNSVVADLYLTCPGSSILVGAGCDGGSQAISDIGADTNVGNQSTGTAVQTMTCKVKYANASGVYSSEQVSYSAGCLSMQSAASATAKVYRMCSYDPDTQQPCTKADAVAMSPSARLQAGPTAEESTGSRAKAIVAGDARTVALAAGQSAGHKKVTLWFED